MAVREALLALLADSPRHGYELKTEFETVTGRLWPLNVGQVYTTLDRLERDGLVRPLSESTHEPDPVNNKRAFEITQEGRGELGRWYTHADGDEPPPRDEARSLLNLLETTHRDEPIRETLPTIGRPETEEESKPAP